MEQTKTHDTVGALLKDALQDVHKLNAGSRAVLYTHPDLPGYAIRLQKKRRKDINHALHGTTSLTPPNYVFVGPQVSQALMAFNPTNGAKLFANNTALEIVPLQEGQNLRQLLSEDPEQQKEKLERIIDKPKSELHEQMIDIFKQAAFVSATPGAIQSLDKENVNFMIDPQGNFALVDAVGGENLTSRAGQDKHNFHDSDTKVGVMRSLNVIRDHLSSIAAAADDIVDQDKVNAFRAQIEAAHQIVRFDTVFSEQNATRQVKKTVPDSWQGFVKREKLLDTKKSAFKDPETEFCISLQDPPEKLLNALKAVEAKAVVR